MQNFSADAQMFFIPICILAGLLLIAMVRILFLLRTNRRLQLHSDNMERQVLSQQREVISIRQDSNAWRGGMQMQFDAFRAQSSRRLEDSEMRYDQAIKQHERQFAELQATLSQALQKSLEPRPYTPPAPPAPPSPAPPRQEAAEMVLPKFEEGLVPAAAE